MTIQLWWYNRLNMLNLYRDQPVKYMSLEATILLSFSCHSFWYLKFWFTHSSFYSAVNGLEFLGVRGFGAGLNRSRILNNNLHSPLPRGPAVRQCRKRENLWSNLGAVSRSVFSLRTLGTPIHSIPLCFAPVCPSNPTLVLCSCPTPVGWRVQTLVAVL